MARTLLLILAFACVLVTITSFTTYSYTPSRITHYGMDESENSINRESSILQATNGYGNDLSKESKKLVSTRFRRSFLVSIGATLACLANGGMVANAVEPPKFKRISTQFIAALGDPKSSSGANVNEWGLWTLDPGPRGVYLKDYTKKIVTNNGVAPSGWKFDEKDWWVEEHGLIMEAPEFPLEAGRYLVTGGRSVTTPLTVTNDGKWSLEQGELYDVTHLPCRSARYTPNGDGSPLTANQSNFPVKPGAEMPKVDGCNKLDYAVLFVIGKEVV